jgi:predicted cobalt transporter CbtA
MLQAGLIILAIGLIGLLVNVYTIATMGNIMSEGVMGIGLIGLLVFFLLTILGWKLIAKERSKSK